MQDTVDLLQIKIEKAKSQLPESTLSAIAAVPWQATILKMRETKGYSFEQLGDLQLETELLLCGLVSSAEYPKELENRMGISKAAANELVIEMNKEVFSKIKEELIKNTEKKKMFTKNNPPAPAPVQNGLEKTAPRDNEKEEKINTQVLKSAGIEITNESGKKEVLPIPEKLELPPLVKPTTSNPTPVLPKKEPAPMANPESSQNIPIPKKVPPIFAQKLSGSFQIPSVKTEHTLENLTKTGTTTSGEIKADKPRIDPYREIPE